MYLLEVFLWPNGIRFDEVATSSTILSMLFKAAKVLLENFSDDDLEDDPEFFVFLFLLLEDWYEVAI
jgi:hypothetical protein